MGKDRILVVDDDPDNRAMITHFLSSWGFIVDAAKNGRMALERVESDPPSLVLLDLEMPEMDGFEACERLKTNPKTEWIPVIIFTGLEKMSHRIRGFRHGADDYVLKTMEPDELRTRIQAVLKRTKKYSSLAALGAQQAAAGAAPPPVARAAAPAATPAKAAAKRKPKPKAKAKSKAKSKPRTKAGTAQNAAAAPTASADSAVSISLERTPFPDAMKLVLAHGRSGVVEVQNGKHQGKVAVHEGGVIHAIHGQRVGEEAFYELALWRKGRFEFKQGAPAKKRTITTSTRRLLVEASRRLDTWNMIVSKVKNFDLIPKWLPMSAKSIRLTKSDWAVIHLVDGCRSIRQIVDELKTDIFEAGRVVYSLITVGVLRLDKDSDPHDGPFDLVPQRGNNILIDEPFALTLHEWELLSQVDGQRNLGTIRSAMKMTPPEFMKSVRGLKEKGFLKLVGREQR